MKALTVLFLAGAVLAQAQSRPAAPAEPNFANLPAQRIGPNDLIAVSVYDAPELTRTVRVGADGLIRLPMLGRRIKAEGLMPAEAETAIADALREEGLIVDPFVTVTLAEYHSHPISVAGAVRTPVTFQAEGPVTLLEAITRAGGLSPEAGREILVTRPVAGSGDPPQAAVLRVAVKDFIDKANPMANVTLRGGEEVRVPESGKVYVVGNVRKPGSFPLRDASETTILKALAMAEGLAPYACGQAYIYRHDAVTGAKQEIRVPLKAIMKRRSPDSPLVANDVLYIPDNSGKRTTMTAIDKITGFGASTVSGILVWGAR